MPHPRTLTKWYKKINGEHGLLLNCINGGWKLPVGYFFITSLTGDQKAELLKMCIQKCEEVGVEVVMTTCDQQLILACFQSLGVSYHKLKCVFFLLIECNLCAFIEPYIPLRILKS